MYYYFQNDYKQIKVENKAAERQYHARSENVHGIQQMTK